MRHPGCHSLQGDLVGHSALMPANLTTLPHFSVSSAMRFPKSVGDPASTIPPRSASRALVDLVVGRIAESSEEDIHTEVLFHDGIVVVAGLQNRWSRRRKVDLSELADEPWAFPQPESPFNGPVAELFRARGLRFPSRGLARGSVHLLCALVARGPF